jgi:hypothetical protein
MNDGTGLRRAEDEALGEFLGYPEAAVDAYCDDDPATDDRLLDTLSDEELTDAFGPLTKLYDALDVDYRAFTASLLPYVVPATVPECLDRMVHDATRFVMAGIVVADEYGLTLFDRVLADYREHLAPDAE